PGLSATIRSQHPMTLETDTSPLARAGRARVFAFYGGMIAIAVIAFLAIRASGDQLTAPAGAGLSQAPGRSINSTLFQALLALGVIIGTARAMGVLFGFIGQPAVIGELVGGIMLGPSFLGQIAPALHDQLLPTSVTAFLGV